MEKIANGTLLPPPAEGLRRGPDGRPRSVLFIHNSYYHFYYLAAALRRRGWDALSVSFESPEGVNAPFYHGEDINLFHPEYTGIAARVESLKVLIPRRFRWLQFAGDGMMAIAPQHQDTSPRREKVPHEFLEFIRAGIKVGYSAGGCADGIAQSSFYRWSGHSCDACNLKQMPHTCSDLRNLAWGHKREMFCDLVASEMLPALDYCSGPKVFREPLTLAVDPLVWRPDIDVPKRLRVEREPDEVLIYHAVGNYRDPHYGGERDYKGTRAIMAAIEGLKNEGLPVRLIFVHDLPSVEVRFVQVQADIVVDQLHAGRYGANGRECLMLGKPVVGFIRKEEENEVPELRSLAECPIVNASIDTIQAVLRRLVLDRDERRRIGAESRRFAERWHSAEALAERFEAVYDHVMAGGLPGGAPVTVPEAPVPVRLGATARP